MSDFWVRILGQEKDKEIENKRERYSDEARAYSEVTAKSAAERARVSVTPRARITPEPVVTVGYDQRVLRIKSRIDLPGILQKELPKGTVVAKDGVISVAFYYLPVLLRLLRRQFKEDEVYVSPSIPYVSEVGKLLGVRGLVDVEAELAEALNEQVTKLLLERREPREAQEIIEELRGELKRKKWIDSIWKRAGMEFVKPSSGWRRVLTNGEVKWIKTSGDS